MVSIDPFVDIIGRHFEQPEEGLGWDNSPSAYMWRTIMMPDRPMQVLRKTSSSTTR